MLYIGFDIDLELPTDLQLKICPLEILIQIRQLIELILRLTKSFS